MRVSRKFQKLFSVDAIESFWEHACRWTHPVNSRRILATLDRSELAKLREQYPHRPNARKINAYENAAYWIGVNVERARQTESGMNGRPRIGNFLSKISERVF